MKSAFGQSIMYFAISIFYSYAFYFGGVLMAEGLKTRDNEYSGGTILTCMFCVLNGAFYLGGAGPHIKMIAEARVAGKQTF
jgi:hypothetical protein